MEADLQRYYNIDYTDRWRGTLSLRRIGVLVENLPQGAAAYRALEVSQAWTDGEHLAASQMDMLAILAWQQTKDGQKNRNKPQPIPRPGDKPDETERQKIGGEAQTVDEIEQWLKDIAEGMTPEDDPSTGVPATARVLGAAHHPTD